MTEVYDTDAAVVIIGGGLAGLMTALALAPQPVLLLTRAPLGFQTSSTLAQGGIAASIGIDDDASLHLAIRSPPGMASAMTSSPQRSSPSRPRRLNSWCGSALRSIGTPMAGSFLVSRLRIRAAGSFMPEVTPAAAT